MALVVSGIGPADCLDDIAAHGSEFVVVLSGTMADCKAAAQLLFDEVSLTPLSTPAEKAVTGPGTSPASGPVIGAAE